MDDRQGQRAAINESRFRAHKEAIGGALEEFDGGESHARYGFMCECASPDCEKTVELARDEYAHVRSDAAWFLVTPSHVLPEIERSIEQHDRYWIVEKFGPGRDVAQAVDPR